MLRQARGVGGLLAASVIALLLVTAVFAQGTSPIEPAGPNDVFSEPTYSSPIALSADKLRVWSVNPDDDSVSVIDTSTDTEIFRIPVGDEPQSVALDPNNQYAYVANAADNSVTVIHITSQNPFGAAVAIPALTTGAEPWNIVISPDGKRVYVANSAQDTITVIKADVTHPTLPTIIGSFDLRSSACNVGDTDRHFQPRGLAVTLGNTQLYVTRFLSFVKTGGTQAVNDGKEGVVCRLTIDTSVPTIGISSPTPITLAAQNSGFSNELAYPNQLQSVVIRGSRAYMPNIAAAPAGPLKFNNDTHAFVNVISGVGTGSQTDAGALNLHLGARIPESGKTKLFFSNPWAIAFTNQSGTGNAYVVSAGSDLLVKLSVNGSGVLTFTGGVSTTTYIDLNDPGDPATGGRDAGKNPLGIVIRNTGPSVKAYVMNYVSRNVTVVDLSTDAVSTVVPLTALPLPDTIDEQLQVGKEMFFSSRGVFDGGKVNRLSSEGWQNCASCHFAGLTDGNIWAFGAGPRKSVPLNSTFSPHNPDDQRVLNYSAIFDEVQDFELNIRNVSGPGPISAGPPPVLDPNHGLIISDTGDINAAPAVVNGFARANAGRQQLTVTLPNSTRAWLALDALTEWVRFGIRTPNGALTTSELPVGNSTGGLSPTDVALGRRLFFQAGCQLCHGGTKWTTSNKDFTSPPAAAEIATENPPIATTVNTQYLPRFLSNISSFNLNVVGGGNLIPGTPSIGAVEVATDGKDALGKDYDGNGTGNGYNIPSLLGIWAVPPYYHNGACETLDCVLSNVTHRTANNTRPDVLNTSLNRDRLVAFLRSLDDQTVFPSNLSVNAHDIFFDPPVVFQSATVTVGVNASLFGTLADLAPISNTLKVRFTGPGLDKEVTLPPFTQDFGQATAVVTWSVPSTTGIARVTVQVDSTDVFSEANEADNTASRLVIIRTPPPDTTPPVVDRMFISDDNPFNNSDPIVTTRNVQVRIAAHDPASPPNTSGLSHYCIVRYHYSVVLRRWVEQACSFEPLPAPDVIAGDVFTYTVSETIPPFEGTAYAFAWVKDTAGNISRAPGFDVVSFIPATSINIARNDVRLFRILLTPSQRITFTLPVVFGDVDVSVFDSVQINATRIALSANNSTLTETVTFTNTFGANRVFQMEVRAIVNSRFSIQYQQAAASALFADALPVKPDSVADLNDSKPLIAGPPAMQTAIGLPGEVYLPVILR